MSRSFAGGDRPPVRRELGEGERLAGTVVRLPSRGAVDGNRLVLQTPDGLVSVPATARRGWTVFERGLAAVQVGDSVVVWFVSWRESQDGRRYRLVRVDVIDPIGGFDAAA